jgi:hypothetical protein
MKLNVGHRASIVEKAIAHAFDKRDKAHEKDRMKFAHELYTHHYGDAEKIAATLPIEWQNHTISLGIQHPDFSTRYEIEDNRAKSSFIMPVKRLKPSVGNVWLSIKPDHPLYDRATDLARAEVAIKAERRELRVKLNTIVTSATTLKQLAEQWPAGVKFFPAETKPEGRALVPVNLINDVNTTLGLSV